MNSVARSVALRALHRREVRDRLQRPAAAAAAGNKNQLQPAAAAAAAAYSSTADRLAAYRRYRTDGGHLLVPFVAVGASIWLLATSATRYVMTRPRHGTTTTTTTVEGPRPEVAAFADELNQGPTIARA